jgi:hypothetical protein
VLLTKTIAGAAAALLTTGLAAVGVGTLGHHDAATAADRPDQQPTVRCHRALERLPADLRSDLLAARSLPAGQRGKAVRAVGLKALEDDYGRQAQRWAIHRIRHRAVLVARMPGDLRRDLRAVRKLPADRRPAARMAIRAKARAGDYGERAEKLAERRQQHRCG